MTSLVAKGWINSCLSACVIMALAACGGGGGGGGNNNSSGNTNNNFSVTFSKNQITENLSTVGDTFILDATAVGDPGVSTVYVGVVAQGDAIASVNMTLGASTGSLFINAKRDLWTGVYTGNITVNFCSDQTCNKHLAKSPYTIPYAFTVKSPLPRLEPLSNPSVKQYSVNSISQEMVVYTQGAKPSQTIQMRLDLPDSITSYSFDPKIQQELSITNLQRTGFTLVLPAKPTGESYYEWFPTVKTMDSAGKEDVIAFRIVQFVSPNEVDVNSFYLEKNSVTFNLPVGFDRRGSVAIPYYRPYSECGKSLQLLDVTVDYLNGADWLTYSDYQHVLGIQANQKGLEKGTYKAKVTAKTCDGLSQTVDVTMLVDSMFVLDEYFNSTLYISSQEGSFDELKIALSITSDAYPITWKVTAPDGGLQLTPESLTGSADAPTNEGNYIKFKLMPEYIAALPNNATYIKRIQVEDPSGKLKPVTADVKFAKWVPEITSVSTQVIEAGQPFVLTIEGNNLPDDLVWTPLAIAPKNNIDGLSGFLPLTISYVDMIGNGARFNFSAIPTPGDYELVVQNEAESKLGYTLPLVPRVQLKVVAPTTKSKVNYQLLPITAP